MSTLPDPNSVKVYTVNGAASSSSSALPDWLTRKRDAKSKGKRVVREHIEGTLELLQHFEFPEASNRIKVTRDGHHAVATGTYKPQMRVWDLDQLSLKFERHSDAENVDFLMLSDDWTKSIHLQNDRSVELHSQGGLHYSTRIPRFGRALGYHFPSCDALVAGAGSEVYRLNLDQGRFMSPLQLQDEGGDELLGVNVIDINPAHQLFAFGIEGNATVQFWDPRSRTRVGLLDLPVNRLLPAGKPAASTLPGVVDDVGSDVSVTAIASRVDGLSYAIGTSTGHTLLYDIRSPRPSAIKDQGYGLPVKVVSWIEGGSRMAGDGLILSADKKVIKIWDRHSPTTNFTSITPAADINDVCHVPGSGLLMLANEGIQMTSYFIPQLGPAPKWCSFLENLTEEMEDQTTRTAYQDYKFVERSELSSLGLDHLVGTPVIKPYMHGYFLSLKLYDTARLIANPYVYEEHRERMVQEKMDKMAETRIRARKDGGGVKVNKALAEKIRKEEERERKRQEKKKVARKERAGEDGDGNAMVVDEVENTTNETGASSLLNDPRFKELFDNPDFQVDEQSREFALLNPSSVAQRQNLLNATGRKGRTKTAVEEEEEESDKPSSDGLGSDESESDGESSKSGSEDSDAAGELWTDDIRARIAARDSGIRAQRKARQQPRHPSVRLVPLQTQLNGRDERFNKNASFGQRRTASHSTTNSKGKDKMRDMDSVSFGADGGMEMTYIPSSGAANADSVDGGASNRSKKPQRRKGVESFGAGMEKGGEEPELGLSESERKGRTQRRKGMRSGSKNTFRRM
ncbi:WD40-repeat-containing domain protein [Cytidiella melzeri]|nr:WD40-repeat-containing domain protein [Cytidiella melzeri]